MKQVTLCDQSLYRPFLANITQRIFLLKLPNQLDDQYAKFSTFPVFIVWNLASVITFRNVETRHLMWLVCTQSVFSNITQNIFLRKLSHQLDDQYTKVATFPSFLLWRLPNVIRLIAHETNHFMWLITIQRFSSNITQTILLRKYSHITKRINIQRLPRLQVLLRRTCLM